MRPTEKLQDISELTSIINSRAYRLVLDERRDYLQKEINRFVREQNLMGAYGCLCKFDDLGKTLEMIELKLKELKK